VAESRNLDVLGMHVLCSPFALPNFRVAWIQELVSHGGQADRLFSRHRSALARFREIERESATAGLCQQAGQLSHEQCDVMFKHSTGPLGGGWSVRASGWALPAGQQQNIHNWTATPVHNTASSNNPGLTACLEDDTRPRLAEGLAVYRAIQQNALSTPRERETHRRLPPPGIVLSSPRKTTR
jgi:hypothetical protein